MKKVGRFLAVSAAAVCALGTMTSCNKTGFKVGLLCLHGQTSTYDNNFIDGFTRACIDCELDPNQFEIRTDVAEDYNQIYSAAKEWAEDGYSMIFADSFGHQEGMLSVAKEYPNTEFCHGTGTFARVNQDVPNFHNAFANIYQGRYLAGIVAGYKLAEKHEGLTDNITIGYVGAYPYAEVISGYTSFYLGVKKGYVMAKKDNDPFADSTLATGIKMKVVYTGSWYDYKAEKEKAEMLITKEGCELLSQHADSMGAPQACARYNIPNVCYNISTKDTTPETYLVASKIDWYPYFKKVITTVKERYEGTGTSTIPNDFSGALEGESATAEEGSVRIIDYGKNATSNIDTYVNSVKQNLIQGNIQVFDTSTFTVTQNENRNPFAAIELDSNRHVTKYEADYLDYGDYAPDGNVIETKTDGQGRTITYVAESRVDYDGVDNFRSAPYFDLIIDGIELV